MLIDQLPEITTANDADEMPIEQGTTTRKIKILNLLKGVVKKVGDTMTGSLLVKDSRITSGTTPTSDVYGNGFFATDNNEAIVGFLREIALASGQQGILVGARRLVNGGNVENVLRMAVNSSGGKGVYVTDPAAWRSALGAMSQAGTDISGTDTTSASGDYASAIKTILTANAPQSWAKGMYCGSIRKTNSGTQTAWTGMYLLNVFNPNANWSTQGLVVAQGYIFSIWYKSGAWDVLRFALA